MNRFTVVLLTFVLANTMYAGVTREWEDATKKLRPSPGSVDLAEVPPIAFVKRKEFGIFGSNATMFSHGTVPGSSICIFDPNHPQKEPKTIFETQDGFILDISPSYDGKKLLMTYKETQKVSFHIWEIGIDGKGLRQITTGPYHDFNPVYYPDGRIVFCSSRSESYSLCQDFLASSMHICNGDGSDIRRIDFTTLCTVTPAIMPDGSIVCSRWEYQDKNIFSWQGLWTINPNGRQLKLYYGNTLTVPNSLYGPKPIPGTSKVLYTMAAHHEQPIGDIAIVDRSKGIENPDASIKITSGTPYTFTKDEWKVGEKWSQRPTWQPGDIFYPGAYVDPEPINSEMSVVSYRGTHSYHGLYLLRHDGFKAPLFTPVRHQRYSCFSAVPLAPRKKPSVIPGDCPQEAGEGTMFVQDVYQGLEEQGVKRGQVKALRIMKVQPKKFNTEGPRYYDHYPLIGYGSYYVKDNLGTVPVNEDGAAYFTAPSNSELYFIALDKDGKEIQRMGSVTQITTGEKVSCVGCHEDRDAAPRSNKAAFKRLATKPDAIKAPSWGAGPIDYVKVVQPVLDKHCVSCHSNQDAKGNIELTDDKTRFFNMSYENLVQKNFVDAYWIHTGPTGEFPALSSGSWSSKLTEMIEKKHGKADLSDEERRAIYAWIDSNVQYYSQWEMSRPYTTGGRDAWGFADKNKKMSYEPWAVTFTETFNKSCTDCHQPFHLKRSRPMPQDVWVNLTHPEKSRVLHAHRPKEQGGRGIAMKKGDKTSKYDPAVIDAMKKSLIEGSAKLKAKPRMDMEGAKPLAQERDFGKVFGWW